MPAAVETFGNQAAFASFRQPAWHNLGTVFNEPVTPVRMLELAHLDDWNVRPIAIDTLLPPQVNGSGLPKSVIVRNNPFWTPENGLQKYDALGVVGNEYSILQNEEMAEFGKLLNATPETAGSLNGGKTVFVAYRLDSELVIDEQGAHDVINQYLLLYTSHDGSSKFVVAVTPVRVVCQNTLTIAKRGMKPVMEISHSKNMSANVAQAKKAMELQVKYTTKFVESANVFHQTPVDDNEFDTIIKQAYDEKTVDNDSKASVTRWNNKRDALFSLWRGKTNENIAGTAWAAFNALTEDQQWNRKVYAGNEEKKAAAGAGFNSLANTERNRLFSVVSEFVGV